MIKDSPAVPKLTIASLIFGLCLILALITLTLSLGEILVPTKVGLGNCLLDKEIAKTSSAKAKGLSGRLEIDKNLAMLFPFKQESPSFWMKDMLTSIDIIWVAKDQVVKIDANLPLDDGLMSYSPNQPIDWVIEVAANRAEQCQVKIGTKINGLSY